MGHELCPCTSEICPRLFDIFSRHSYGDIFFLHDRVRICSLAGKHIVILFSVDIKIISLHADQDFSPKVCSVQPAVIDSELRYCGTVECIEYLRISEEHSLFVFGRRYIIVDVLESERLAEFVLSCLENAIRVYALHRDDVLHVLR